MGINHIPGFICLAMKIDNQNGKNRGVLNKDNIRPFTSQYLPSTYSLNKITERSPKNLAFPSVGYEMESGT